MRVEIILRVFWWFREYIFFLVFEAKINSLLLIENNKTQVLLLFFLFEYYKISILHNDFKF